MGMNVFPPQSTHEKRDKGKWWLEMWRVTFFPYFYVLLLILWRSGSAFEFKNKSTVNDLYKKKKTQKVLNYF